MKNSNVNNKTIVFSNTILQKCEKSRKTSFFSLVKAKMPPYNSDISIITIQEVTNNV